MLTTIEKFRKRTGLTQQAVADMLHTDKSYISHIEHNRRDMTQTMYSAGFNNATDGHLLNDMAHEVTAGHTPPSASNRVYDDHRMSIKHRLKREIQEFIEVTSDHCLDKRPEFLTPDEKELIVTQISELQDILFEGNHFISRIVEDYDFINPQHLKKNRDARLKMERRI